VTRNPPVVSGLTQPCVPIFLAIVTLVCDGWAIAHTHSWRCCCCPCTVLCPCGCGRMVLSLVDAVAVRAGTERMVLSGLSVARREGRW
jgi:hypothetical protein